MNGSPTPTGATRRAPPGAATRIALLLASSALAVLVARSVSVYAATTPATGAVTDQLITQQGSGVLTQYGDFIAANAGAGGLNRPYSYYVEVPPGLANLVVDLFDADVGAGGTDLASDRDRNIGAFNTCARYQLVRPNGTVAATTVRGPAGGCVLTPNSNAGDNVWQNFSTQANPAAGHWEIRVDMSTAVTTGNDVNAFGIRAHDGTPGAGGTELNVYAESFYIIGVNQNGRTRNYNLYPYISSGCVADVNDFDFDAAGGNPYGSVSLTRRGGGYTHTNSTMSGNDVWQNVPFTGWTNDQTSVGYGLWTGLFGIQDYGSGNYGPLYLGSFSAANPPPTSQPQAGTFRIYLPTDGSAAPVRPYVEQLLAVSGGPNPPLVGQTTVMTVTVRVTNPAPRAITFSTPTNVVTTTVPGSGALYAGSAQVSQGSLVSQPAVGGTGNVVWNPGTVAAGATALLTYRVNVTPTSSGQRIPVTGTPASNGTTARYLDDTGNATQARATYTFGPLCELAAQQGVLTHALVSSFEAVSEGSGVRVVWETATEVGTVSFALYRYQPRERRWTAVNEEPLLAPPGVPQGARYELEDPGAPVSGQLIYALLERTFDGRELLHGPYVVEVDSGARDFGRKPPPRASRTRLLERLRATRSKRSSLSDRGLRFRRFGAAIQIRARDRGLYYLDAARIAELLGLPHAWVRARLGERRFSLSNRGRPVAWDLAPDESGIYFYGEGLDSPYSDLNVYRLEPGEGLSMATLAGSAADDDGAGASFTETLLREEDRFAGTVASRDPDSDFWFWEALVAGDPAQSSKRFEVAAAGVARTGTRASVGLELVGATSSAVPDEHRVLVSINGIPVGETVFSGLTRQWSELEFPQSFLVEGTNEVELTAVLEPDVPQSIVYLDSFALRYARHYQADAPSFVFRGENHGAVSVDGFAEPSISVLDVSEPSRPAWISGGRVEPSTLGYRVTFAPPAPGATLLAVTPSGVRLPEAVSSDAPSRLRSRWNGADYLVIAPEELARGAQALAAYRGKQGMRAKVVLAEDVMDEFNFGIESPHALHDFLAYVHQHWRKEPRYVVLVGKGTFDYRDVLGQGDNRLPPLMAATQEGLFASDVRLADVSGNDGVPEFSIGRIPVLSDDELLAYVAMVREHETAPSDGRARRVLIAADHPRGADFQADAEALAGLLPSTYEVSRVYLADPWPGASARERLLDELRKGVYWFSYTGHGALDRLSSDGLLTVSDVPSLGNGGRRPVVAAWTCSTGRFDVPGYVSLGEELVLGTEGGAVAVWAPTGLSDNVQAQWMAEEFFGATVLGGDERLGDALRRTAEAFRERGGSKSMLLIYQLLGDPALLLHRPEPLPGE